ncbi:MULTISPECIES: J domain-containing protein [unclassified Fusobacterium]|uniref:J domain-containing protein n=1 Tax=Fusobacterium sp. TaxID=68766 RepID=UPI0025BFD8D2|nr:DnaJ domain-containing protein [Fusobacterium sp.]
MIYSISLTFILILFLFIGLTFGFNRAVGMIPVLFIVFLLVAFLGWFAVNFFWVILLVVLINYLKNKNQPKSTKRRTYYYRYDSNGASDFEEFFRQASGNYSRQQYSGNYETPFGYAEDKSKYYTILGVTKDAGKDEIKKAYRDLVKQHHPDKFTNASESEKEYHENKLKEINEAYEKLSKDFS